MIKKVLLADDSVTIQKVVKIILADGDYALQVVDNGEAALAKAQVDRPDIVLADVYMPGKNGYELCAAIKQEPTLAGVPVLLLSGTFEAFDESRALAVGADGWIAKPFESSALIEQIDGVLARSATVAAFPGATVEADEVSAVSVTEPDIWATLEMDTPQTEGNKDFSVDETVEEEDAFDEVELEADGLWDDEPLLDQDESNLELAEEQETQTDDLDFDEIDAVTASSIELAPSEVLAQSPEEEVLFLDESDLLIEDVEDVDTNTEEETFEFITQEESLLQEPVEEPVEVFADNSLVADELSELTMAEEPAMATEEDRVAEEELAAEEDMADEEDMVAEEDMADEEDIAAENLLEPESIADPILVAGLDASPEPEPEPVVEKVAIAVNGLNFFSNSSLISKIAGTHKPEPVPESVVTIADPEPQESTLSKDEVVERVQGLSEQDLAAIVEQVAGRIIEGLAATVLERIAWEVVPDLAESLIKEEISRITVEQD